MALPSHSPRRRRRTPRRRAASEIPPKISAAPNASRRTVLGVGPTRPFVARMSLVAFALALSVGVSGVVGGSSSSAAGVGRAFFSPPPLFLFPASRSSLLSFSTSGSLGGRRVGSKTTTPTPPGSYLPPSTGRRCTAADAPVGQHRQTCSSLSSSAADVDVGGETGRVVEKSAAVEVSLIERLLSSADDDHAAAFRSTPFPVEEPAVWGRERDAPPNAARAVPVDPCQFFSSAVRTYSADGGDSAPLLNPDLAIRMSSAASRLWSSWGDDDDGEEGQSGESPGRYEADLSDVLRASDHDSVGLTEEFESALAERVYPLARETFGDLLGLGRTPNEPPPLLFVLDARVVRTVGGGGRNGGGGSGRMDLGSGLVTVRIALNPPPPLSSADARSGGTILEGLLARPVPASDVSATVVEATASVATVPPLEAGHGLLHPSSERSALLPPEQLDEGAMSDVLILSLSEGPSPAAEDSSGTETAPPAERLNRFLDKALRLPSLTTEERGACLEAAAAVASGLPPAAKGGGAEAEFWLGMHTLDGAGRVGADGEAAVAAMADAGLSRLRAACEAVPGNAKFRHSLGGALLARMSTEARNPGSSPEKAMSLLNEATAVLTEAVRIEEILSDLGLGNIDDYASSLIFLGDVYLRLGRFDDMIRCIDDLHRVTSAKHPFAIEDKSRMDAADASGGPSFDWIYGVPRLDPHSHGGASTASALASAPIAVRSTGPEPILDGDTVRLIRTAAHRYWEATNGGTSRFSMQYEGNSEVHLHELTASDPALREAVDRALVTRVYPLVREAFGSQGDGVPEGELCVYDSIVIRYDGDVAREKGRVGASQPLHQDFGQFSVNVALNSHEATCSAGEPGFEGGGTYFVDLVGMNDDDEGGRGSSPPPILRPIGPGHAVAHRSTIRHAGAPTTSGRREILVLFLTTRQRQSQGRGEPGGPGSSGAPGVERGYRLKTMSQSSPRPALRRCLEMSSSENPSDGDAPYLLGRMLVFGGGGGAATEGERREEIIRGADLLERAASLAPCDSRVQYYLALARQARMMCAARGAGEEDNRGGTGGGAAIAPSRVEEMERVREAVDAAIRLERVGAENGCSEGLDIGRALYSLGENYARMGAGGDREVLREAIRCLEGIKEHCSAEDRGLVKEALPIIDYCQGVLSKSP